MLRTVAVFCAVLALARGQTTEVSACTVHDGELPLNTHIVGCTTPPCALPQLEDVVVNIVFKTPYLIRDMSTVATAYLPTIFGNIPYPYNLGQNAVTCNFLTNSYCPLVEGEVIQYVLRMYIESFFPVGTQASIEFRVVDHNNTPFLCIRVPIRIVEAVNNRVGAQNATVTVEV